MQNTRHTLEAVIQMPGELFQPYANATTAVIYLRKGVPHPKGKRVYFARVANDGLRLKKGVRVATEGSELSKALDHFLAHASEPGFSGWGALDDKNSFAPGAYIPAREMGEVETDEAVREVIRARSAFVALHAAELVTLNTDDQIDPRKMRKLRPLRSLAGGTVGEYFHVIYGQKALHSKDGLVTGDTLVISSSGMDNGCYGFFDRDPLRVPPFDGILKPPFVTVPSTGSIAVAHVQEWPCGVTDDCLLLLPKDGVRHAMLYVAAASIRNERWRFSYGRKATPERIAYFPLPHTDELLDRVEIYLGRAAQVEDQMLENAEDALDGQVARARLAELGSGREALVSGAKLEARLAAMMED